MAKKIQKKKKGKATPQPQEVRPKDFLDLIAPAAVKFNTDHYICGSMYHCTLALRSYPATTDELALLQRLGEKSGVTLSVYARQVTTAEENGILHNAENKNRMARSSTNNMKQAVTAEGNLQDVAELIAAMRKNREPLIHCAVYIDLSARDSESLRILREEVTAELIRSKLEADRLLLRQQDGFLSSNPMGRNTFKSQYERVLPAGSVANLYPFNYSGKTDPHGFYVGRDRYGSNIIVDLDRRTEDKTTASVLILGNSGQGKSYLLKLLLCNILEAGKSVICLDPEHELIDLCSSLGGCFIDLMSGQYQINLLEPKVWDVSGEDDPEAPATFRQKTRLSQHISFLKDFFRSWKISSWSLRSLSSFATTRGVYASTNAAMNGICWRFMLLRIRRNCLGVPAGDKCQTKEEVRLGEHCYGYRNQSSSSRLNRRECQKENRMGAGGHLLTSDSAHRPAVLPGIRRS